MITRLTAEIPQLSDRECDYLTNAEKAPMEFMTKVFLSPDTIERTKLLDIFTEAVISDGDQPELAIKRIIDHQKDTILQLLNGGYIS